MISRELAIRLREAGLVWRPKKGDFFELLADVDSDVTDGGGREVFTVSDMTIEAHEYPTGTVLGFNGTTEWALDSVDLADAVWFPREDQLRDALKQTFQRLERLERTAPDDGFAVETVFRGEQRRFEAAAADEAYGLAVLEQVLAAR